MYKSVDMGPFSWPRWVFPSINRITKNVGNSCLLELHKLKSMPYIAHMGFFEYI